MGHSLHRTPFDCWNGLSNDGTGSSRSGKGVVKLKEGVNSVSVETGHGWWYIAIYGDYIGVGLNLERKKRKRQ